MTEMILISPRLLLAAHCMCVSTASRYEPVQPFEYVILEAKTGNKGVGFNIIILSGCSSGAVINFLKFATVCLPARLPGQKKGHHTKGIIRLGY